MAVESPRGMLSMLSNLLAGLTCKVHPVVLASIVDSFERRNEGVKRIIGTLLGTVDKGVVEITNCFTVPHEEGDEEVAVDIEFSKNMYELHRKVNLQEVIVGWYSTGHDVVDQSVLIHDYYARECKNPIHLVVDTSLRNYRMSIKAFVSTQVGVPDRTIGTMFTPVPLEVVYHDQERVGLEYLIKNRDKSRKNTSLSTDMSQLLANCQDMAVNLERVVEYVEAVVEGDIPSDPQVGRLLMELVNSVTKLDPQRFEDLVSQNQRDLLMIVYLTDLTKIQLAIGEKLAQV